MDWKNQNECAMSDTTKVGNLIYMPCGMETEQLFEDKENDNSPKKYNKQWWSDHWATKGSSAAIQDLVKPGKLLLLLLSILCKE